MAHVESHERLPYSPRRLLIELVELSKGSEGFLMTHVGNGEGEKIRGQA